MDQPAKIEASSPTLEKNSGSAAENGSVSYDLINSQVPAAVPAIPELVPTEAMKPDISVASDSRHLTEESTSKEVGVTTKEEPQSPKKESPRGVRLDDDRDNLAVNKL